MASRWEPELLLITWIDAATSDEAWTTVEEFEVPDTQVQSVGWLVQETPFTLTIAMSKGSEDTGICTLLTIPKPWLKQRITLEP